MKRHSKRDTTINTRSQWFKKHDRILTVLGAVIVFATFLVKDHFLDRYKESVATVNAAESVLLNRDDNIMTVELLRGLATETASIDAKMKPTAADYHYRAWLRGSLNAEENTRIQTALAYLQRLALQLTNPNQGEDALKKLREQWEATRKEQATTDFPATMMVDDPHNPLLESYNLRVEREKIKHDAFVDQLLLGLENMINSTGDQFLTEAKQRREVSESRLKYATVASYVLYVIGWGLSLVSKLFGKEGDGMEATE